MKQAKRLLSYCVGLYILAIGMTFCILSNLGTSPLGSLPYVTSLVLHMDLGLATTLILAGYVVLQILLTDRKVRPINGLQVVVSSLFGLFMTLAGYTLALVPAVNNIVIRLFYCFLGVWGIAIGIFLYMAPTMLSLPSEGLMLAISARLNWPLPKTKIAFDCTIVALSVMISLVFMRKVAGVGVGTVLAALTVGHCLRACQAVGSTALNRWLNKEDAHV